MKDVSCESWRISFQPSEQAAMDAYVSWMEAASKKDKGFITIDRLREMGVCEGALNFLSDRFGDSVAITEENALACAKSIDWEWAADNLLNEGQRGLYQEALDKHWKAYNEACDPYWKAYNEACDPYWKAYNEACDSYWKAHNGSCDWHLKAYKEVCAKAFVAAYYTR